MTAYNPYSVAPGIEGRQLPSGTDKKGKIYSRSLSFQPGYKDLVNIVAGLQKDVKKINQCLTLEGAQAYVNAVDKNGNTKTSFIPSQRRKNSHSKYHGRSRQRNHSQ